MTAFERRRLLRDAEADHGSAIAEFVMVAALLLVVALGVFQLGLGLYVRNTLISSASEGARYGATADASPSDAVSRTSELVTSALNSSYATDVTVRETTSGDGVRVVEVTLSAPFPVIGILGPSGSMSVTGRAFSERQVTQVSP